MNQSFLSSIKAVIAGVIGLGLILCSETTKLTAQDAPNGIPAHMVVTLEPHSGHEVPPVNKEDVIVFEGHDRDTVTEWVPAQGDRAALELFILIDDSSSSRLGTQLDDIKKFIGGQPESTKIGIAYMQDGTARVVQELTSDHAQAAKAVRLPFGSAGANASPYFSLSDLLKKWPASEARHEVFMVTDGIDRFYGSGDLQDPYLQKAIDDAARGGVLVSAIYNPGAGHFGHSYYQTYWGQIYLSELAEKTGGENYNFGMTGSPVALAPFLDDFANRLQHQYFLTFVAKVPKKAGWQTVRLKTEVKKVDLVSAGQVWVSPEGK
jgi:hypothetical protein